MKSINPKAIEIFLKGFPDILEKRKKLFIDEGYVFLEELDDDNGYSKTETSTIAFEELDIIVKFEFYFPVNDSLKFLLGLEAPKHIFLKNIDISFKTK